jgi:hypothetical protein
MKFIEFQEEIAEFVGDLPEDLRGREAFETVDDLLQQRRLTESDFEEARATLEPAREATARLEERRAARERYARVRSELDRQVSDLDDRIDDLERLVTLGEADLDAPVSEIREPVESYNEAVDEAFAAFKGDAPARAVLGFVDGTDAYPLVDFLAPPADLREYVRTHPPGTEPIPRLLEYAEFSRSKLAHYVDEPGDLKRAVGSHQTYLRRLDADPLTVDWPPPTADVLRWRSRELVAVVGRFAPEDVVARARDLRGMADREGYDRLRESARAREQLDADQRRRLASGAVAEELRACRAERERLVDALAEYPDV